MIHQDVARAHAEARRIHAQNCHCPRCAPSMPRRRSIIEGLQAIWAVTEPADRTSIKWGLGLSALIDGGILLAHYAPAIAAALGAAR